MKSLMVLMVLVVSSRGIAESAKAGDTKLADEVKQLKTETSALQDKLAVINVKNAEQSVKITKQNQEMMELNVKIANQNRLIMEHRMTSAVLKNNVLQTQNNMLERALGSIQHQTDYLKELASQKVKLQKLNETLQQLAKQKHQEFAFFAYLSRSIGPLSPERRIVFDALLTGPSKSYDAETGTLTIPFDGVYELGLNIMAQYKKDASAEIMVNNRRYCSVFVRSTPEFVKRSNSVIVKLKAGDSVYTRTRHLTMNYFYGNMYMYTNFYAKLVA